MSPGTISSLPAGWRWARLGDVLRLRKDVLHPTRQLHGRAAFVGLEHIEPGTGRRTGSLDLDLSTLTGRKPQFSAGDIVYGYLRAPTSTRFGLRSFLVCAPWTSTFTRPTKPLCIGSSS